MAVLAAAALAACGSDDDTDTAAKTTAERKPAPAPDTAVFDSRAVGFTFEYPKDYAAQTKPDGEVLGQVSVEDGEPINAIKVRETAARPLGPERYLDEFQRDFERSVGEVEKSRRKIAGRETGVLEFEDTVELDGEEVEFRSASYFFAGGGKTWQVECIADEEHREEIERTCQLVLESVQFR